MVKDNNDNLINDENIIKKKKKVRKTSDEIKKSNSSEKRTKNTQIKKVTNSSNKNNNRESLNKKNSSSSIKNKNKKSENKTIKKVNKLDEISVLEEIPKKKSNTSKRKNDSKSLNSKDVDKVLEVDKTDNLESHNKKKKAKKVIELEEEIVLEEIKPVKKKCRLKLRLWIRVLLIILLVGIITILGYKYWEKTKAEELKKEQALIVEKVMSHYGEFVLVKEDTVLYRIDEEGNYYEYGMVYANTELSLKEAEITYLTEYFYSTDLESYLKYDYLEPISELTTYDNRYKNYIVFNQNVVTNSEFTLYDNEKKIYTFNESMSFPIIIKDYDGKYYIEFNNRLLYLVKDDIKEFVNVNNASNKNASKVTTLCYHRVYDTNERCNDLYICKKKSNFDKEMKYLKDNNYLTLTMEEMYLYLSKKIQVPKKSVTITLDDGYLFESAIEVLEKYEINATGFIKTGSFSDFSIFKSPNLELHSHTDKMHVAGTCKRELSYQQGGGILCLSETYVLNDLKTSREKLNNAIALAYPFYDFNNRAINLVKKAGFKLAFIGASTTNGRSYPGINLYKVPRMTIWDTTSFTKFKSYVTN